MFARGYNAVGVKEICEQAQVHKGSFYHFFPSKSDLALAVIDRYWEVYQRDFLAVAFADDVPPLDRIERFFRMTYERVRQSLTSGFPIRGCLFGNFTLELSSQDERVREALEASFQRLVGYFERTLAEAVEAGELVDIDTRTTAEALIAYYEGMAVLAKAYKDAEVANRLARGALRLMIPKKK